MIAAFSIGIPAFVRQLVALRVKPFSRRMDFILVRSMESVLRPTICQKESRSEFLSALKKFSVIHHAPVAFCIEVQPSRFSRFNLAPLQFLLLAIS